MELLFDLEPQQRRSRPTSVPSLLILRQPLTVQGCSPSLRCGRFTVSPGRRADGHPPITRNGSTSPLTVPAPSGMTHRGAISHAGCRPNSPAGPHIAGPATSHRLGSEETSQPRRTTLILALTR